VSDFRLWRAAPRPARLVLAELSSITRMTRDRQHALSLLNDMDSGSPHVEERRSMSPPATACCGPRGLHREARSYAVRPGEHRAHHNAAVWIGGMRNNPAGVSRGLRRPPNPRRDHSEPKAGRAQRRYITGNRRVARQRPPCDRAPGILGAPQRRRANSAMTRPRLVVQPRPTSGERSVACLSSQARALYARRTNNPTETRRSNRAG
jgi:hypothetical protein